MIARNPLRNQGRPGFGRRRESARFPGLTLELTPPYLVFRHGRTREVFYLHDGKPRLLTALGGLYTDLAIYAHVRDAAIAYAQALHARKLRRRAR